MRHAKKIYSRAQSVLIAIIVLTVAFLLPMIGDAQTPARIQSTRALNIGFVPDQAPFSFTSADRQPTGYAVDLCRHVTVVLESRLGLDRLNASYVATSAPAGLEMIERGELDLLCGAITETLRARKHVSFSIPIYVTGIGALVRKDASPALLRVLNGQVPHTGPTWRATVNAGLSNQTYAVYAGSTTEARLRERIATLGVIVKIVTVQSHEAGIEMVSQGKAGAFFDDRVVLVSYLSRRKDAGKMQVLDRRFTLEPVALALPRGDEDFRLLVDTALSDLYRSGQYISTYERYFGAPTEAAQMLFQAHALP